MTPSDPVVLCPMCSAECFPTSANCFLCGQSLAGATVVERSKPPAAPAATATGRLTFQITSIMLLIATIAVFLAVLRAAPGLALLLAIPGSIALVRTLLVASDRPGPPSWFEHLAVFLGTFAAVVTVVVAAGASFFGTCLAVVASGPGPHGGTRLGAGMIAGGIVGIAVFASFTAAFVRWGGRRRER